MEARVLLRVAVALLYLGATAVQESSSPALVLESAASTVSPSFAADVVVVVASLAFSSVLRI